MSQLPRVILLIETSRKFGRDLISGITKYSKLHGPWTFYPAPPHLTLIEIGQGISNR